MNIGEQVKKLRELANSKELEMHEPVTYGFYGKIKSKLFEAADTIEALSAKLQAANMERSDMDYGNGWIADREPDESGYYLVTYHEWSNGNFLPKFDDTYVKRLHYQKSGQFTGWNYPKCVDKRVEEDMNVEVLAWQPLPKPYRP